jgi:transposase
MERRKISGETEARSALKAIARAGISTKTWAREYGIDGRSLHAWEMALTRRARRVAKPRRTAALVEFVPTIPVSSARYVMRVGEISFEFGDDASEEMLRRAVGVPAVVLSLPLTVRVFVAVEPLDMRESFDALAGAVHRLGLDPVDGHLYLFLNKRRRLAKALWFDGSGWCVLAKRHEAGNGSSWSSVSGSTQNLVAIWGSSANDIWAVGGTVLHWNGTSSSRLNRQWVRIRAGDRLVASDRRQGT